MDFLEEKFLKLGAENAPGEAIVTLSPLGIC